MVLYIKEIKNMVVIGSDYNFVWSGRDSNKVVDRLSELALQNQCIFSFGMDYPKEIHNIIIDDSF